MKFLILLPLAYFLLCLATRTLDNHLHGGRVLRGRVPGGWR